MITAYLRMCMGIIILVIKGKTNYILWKEKRKRKRVVKSD